MLIKFGLKPKIQTNLDLKTQNVDKLWHLKTKMLTKFGLESKIQTNLTLGSQNVDKNGLFQQVKKKNCSDHYYY